MQYMLLIYTQESGWENLSDEAQAAAMKAYRDFTEELRGAGAMVAGDRLQPIANATTVRVRDGEQLVTDGPYAETKEQLGGYYLIEADSLDAAVEWAKRLRHDADGSIEVRPLLELGVDSGPPGSS
jgi:hypothetical protein